MTKTRRLKETAKTALILLLAVSAFFLGQKTNLFNQLRSGAASALGDGKRPGSAVSTDYRLYMKPSAVVISDGEGHRCGFQYSSSQLEQVYDDMANILGEALGSASAPKNIGENAWRAAVNARGVCFDFGRFLPLAPLTAWFGTGTGSLNMDVRRVCLTVENTAVRLYAQGESGFFVCDTAVSLSSLTAAVEAYMPNDALYAYESGSQYKALDPYDLLLEEAPAALAVAVGTPPTGAQQLEDVLDAFGANHYLSSYTEPDGTEVYVENSYTVRMDPRGKISYRSLSGADENAPGRPGIAGAVELSCELAAKTVGRYSGEAEVCLLKADEQGGGYVVELGYRINGCTVFVAGSESAVKVTVRDGQITAAELLFRSYTTGEPTEGLLPEKQAAAIASGKYGGELVLAYADSGAELLLPEWIVR